MKVAGACIKSSQYIPLKRRNHENHAANSYYLPGVDTKRAITRNLDACNIWDDRNLHMIHGTGWVCLDTGRGSARAGRVVGTPPPESLVGIHHTRGFRSCTRGGQYCTSSFSTRGRPHRVGCTRRCDAIRQWFKSVYRHGRSDGHDKPVVKYGVRSAPSPAMSDGFRQPPAKPTRHPVLQLRWLVRWVSLFVEYQSLDVCICMAACSPIPGDTVCSEIQ